MIYSNDFLAKINDGLEILIESYQDIPVKELESTFNVNSKAKNHLNALTRRLIEYQDSEFIAQLGERDDFLFKTIRLDKYGRLKESMSLPAFKYVEIAEETWKTSSLRRYLKNSTFAFTVYKDAGKELYLKKIILWTMPEYVLENGVRQMWQNVHDCIVQGRIVKYINDGRYFTYFPAASENPYMHVRPHAQNKQDTYPLPVPDKLTGLIAYPKHSFWLNRSYILKIISKDV